MATPAPDAAIVDAFVRRYREDRSAGVRRSLEEYLAQFPGDAEGVAG